MRKPEVNEENEILNKSLTEIKSKVEQYFKVDTTLKAKHKVYSATFYSYINAMEVSLVDLQFADSLELVNASTVYTIGDKIILDYLPVEVLSKEQKLTNIESLKKSFPNKSVFKEQKRLFYHGEKKSFLIMDGSLVLEKNPTITEDRYIIFKSEIIFQPPPY